MKAKRKNQRFKFEKILASTNTNGGKPTSQNIREESIDSNDLDKQEAQNLSHKFMTPKDLEKELGLSMVQQYRLRSANFRERNAKKGGFNLPFIKQMGLIVYDRDDVIEWLNANKVKE